MGKVKFPFKRKWSARDSQKVRSALGSIMTYFVQTVCQMMKSEAIYYFYPPTRLKDRYLRAARKWRKVNVLKDDVELREPEGQSGTALRFVTQLPRKPCRVTNAQLQRT